MALPWAQVEAVKASRQVACRSQPLISLRQSCPPSACMARACKLAKALPAPQSVLPAGGACSCFGVFATKLGAHSGHKTLPPL